MDVTNNKLTAFPAVLAELTQLQRLTLSVNSIAEINGAVLLAFASSLKVLVLDSNAITQVANAKFTLTLSG